MPKNRTIYILAGGHGSRLKSIISTPKPLLSISRKPFLVHLIEWLVLHYFSEINVIISKNEINDYEKVLQNFSFNHLLFTPQINFVSEPRRLGTAGWLYNNMDVMLDEFYVCNADTIFNENISSLLHAVEDSNKSSVFCFHNSSRNDTGSLILEQGTSHRVSAFNEKNSTSRLSSAGLYFFRKIDLLSSFSLFQEFNSEDFKLSLEEEVFPIMVAKKLLHIAPGFISSIHDFGTLDRLSEANKFFDNKPYKWLLFDRDNTINHDLDGYTHKIKDFSLIQKIIPLLDGYQKNGYFLGCVTNQSGIGRGFYTDSTFIDFMSYMASELIKRHGIYINHIEYCPHLPSDNCNCRKPKTGMFEHLRERFSFDFDNSFFIGDSESDALASEHFGVDFLHFLKSSQ